MTDELHPTPEMPETAVPNEANDPTPAEAAPAPAPSTCEAVIDSQADYRRTLRETRRAYSRCGWAVFALTAFLGVIAPIFAIVLKIFSESGGDIASLMENNLLYLNEAIIAVAILGSMLVLLGMPHKAPERKPITPALFFLVFSIGVAMGILGNLRSNLLLSVWGTFTGIVSENDLSATLTSIDPIQMIICTGILAPIIEEFFFRKLLIDRLHRYGELTAILFSAVAFGLFHGNVGQLYYTTAVGLLFGYIYIRTGSYPFAVLLHMAFNFFSGVIPVLLLLGMPEEFLLSGELTLSQGVDAIVSELLYLGYFRVEIGVAATGITLFFLILKKISLPKRTTVLTRKDHVEAATVNAGVITAAAVLFLQLFLSLFTV